MKEKLQIGEALRDVAVLGAMLEERMIFPPARGHIQHQRPKDWKKNPRTGLLEPVYKWFAPEVIDPECVDLLFEDFPVNVKTNAGKNFIHAQYLSTGPGGNGLNYIALSNDTVTETSASTTLSNEIAANGLTRAIGAYAHTADADTSTIIKAFTASGAQSVKKAALFSASSGGTMNHVLALSATRSLITGDILTVTFTITIA